MAEQIYENREAWLHAATERLNEMIAAKTDLKPSKKVHVSVGFPRNDRKGKVIGQCWMKSTGGGGHNIFISPLLGSAADVLHVLLHELIHAADDCQHQHNGPFVVAIRAVGLVGKPTATVAGPELKAELREIASALGKYPHRKMSGTEEDGPKKQVSRQLKVECPDCPCIVRMSRKAIDEIGTPTCACGGKMEESA